MKQKLPQKFGSFTEKPYICTKMVTFRVNEQKERNVMVDVHTIASYISQRYEYQYGSRIAEMKLQILLYFMQRECIVQTGSPLFEAIFYAHTLGPYIPEVHAAYISNSLHVVLPSSIIEEYKTIFDSVFELLSAKKTRSLSNLIHGEDSWKRAMMQGEGTSMDIQDIKEDAARFRVRRFLLTNLEQFHKPVYA